MKYALTVFEALSGDLEASLPRKIDDNSENQKPIVETKDHDYETKIDGMLLAVEDRERELLQALVQERAGQRSHQCTVSLSLIHI